jgi:hypothetical protein
MAAVPKFRRQPDTDEAGIHSDVNSDVRNAAQRFSSSSRLVALRAARDSRETLAMLERLRRAHETLGVANEAVRLAELERRDDTR